MQDELHWGFIGFDVTLKIQFATKLVLFGMFDFKLT